MYNRSILYIILIVIGFACIKCVQCNTDVDSVYADISYCKQVREYKASDGNLGHNDFKNYGDRCQ